jgi:hypothetical protein
MKLPGYWVSKRGEAFTLTHVVFDETELDPATRWEEVYQNNDPQITERGYVDLEAALAYVRGELPDTTSGDDGSQPPQFIDGAMVLRSRREVDRFVNSVPSSAN